MSVDVTTSIEIARARRDVASYAADPDNAMAWYRNIVGVEWQSPRPLVVGSKIAFRARFLGRSLAYVYEVKELVPDERLVMAASGGPFAMETTYEWSDSPGGTRMSLRNRGTPSGFGRLVTPLMEPAMRRANQKDLQRLKETLENRGR